MACDSPSVTRTPAAESQVLWTPDSKKVVYVSDREGAFNLYQYDFTSNSETPLVRGIGQAFVLVDPGALAGRERYLDRIEVLIAEMLRDEGVRLPGARREALRRRAEAEGIEVGDNMLAALRG